MPIIQTISPKGLLPIKDKFKLPEEFSTICDNVELRSGSMVSLAEPSDVLAGRTPVEQISLTPGYTIVKGPINDDQFSRHYYSTNEKTDKMKVLVTKPVNQSLFMQNDPVPLTGGISIGVFAFGPTDGLEFDAAPLSNLDRIIAASADDVSDGVRYTPNASDMGFTILTSVFNFPGITMPAGTHKYFLQRNEDNIELFIDGVSQGIITGTVSLASAFIISDLVNSEVSAVGYPTQTSGDILEAHRDIIYNPTITDNTPVNLYDGDDLTYIEFNQGDSLVYDFDVTPKDITSIMVSFSSAQYVNTTLAVEYSDDNATWVESKRIVLITTSADQIKPVVSGGERRYWRLRAISGNGRLNRFSMYDGTLSTAEARDVFIQAPEEPTIESLALDNAATQATLTIGGVNGTLDKTEIEGVFIKAHFTAASTANGTATTGIYGSSFASVTLGQVYPKDKLDLTKAAIPVGTINLVSVSREVTGGLDYTDKSYNYVVIFEYQLYTSSTQERTAQFVIAYEDDLGQVGEPSTPIEFNAIDKGSIRIAKITFPAVSDSNAIYTRIYRSGSDGQFYQAGKVPIGATEFEDIYEESDYQRLIQGEVLGNFGNPPEGLTNLALVAGGIMAGTDHKKTVWMSDPLKPNIMTYSRTTSSNIVGMASTGSELIVCTDGNPELITGSHPSVMSQDIIMTNQACLSRDSITQVKNAIFYAGTDGLVSVVGARGEVVTRKLISAKQWMEYDPASMIGVSLDGKYYGFNSTGNTFVFDLETAEITNISVSANAAYSDISEDAIYIDQGSGAQKLFGHISKNLSKTVQSKFHRFPNPVTFNAIRVNAESYDDTVVDLYVNGILHTSIAPHNSNSRRLPRMPQAREIYYKVTGTDTVISVEIATSMGELRG